MKFSPAIFLLLLLQPLLAQNESYRGKIKDLGDFYENGKNRISLMRATEELAVGITTTGETDTITEEIRQAAPESTASLIKALTTASGKKIALIKVADTERLEGKLTRVSHAGYIMPVFIHAETGGRIIPTDELVVAADASVTFDKISQILKSNGLDIIKARHRNSYLVRMNGATWPKLTAIVAKVGKIEGIQYIEPDFLIDTQLEYTPNDPFFSVQQSLENTGQNGALNDADVDASAAWNVTKGNSSIVIAIIDTGVDLGHADLKIFNNSSETGGNVGVDDDSNGYIDDLHGWNFDALNNDPSDIDGHGTACAGIAAATDGNSYGISGIAPNCKILPIKVPFGSGIPSSKYSDAIDYAAQFADVISCSWAITSGGPFIDLDNAISHAVTMGRSGKGTPVFFATGNAASNWNYNGSRIKFTTTASSGTYSIGFTYLKANTETGDQAGIDNVALLGSDGYTLVSTSGLGTGGRQDFEGIFPPSGWWLRRSNTSFANLWAANTATPFRGTGGLKSAASGNVAVGHWTEIRTPLLNLVGTFTLAADYYVSSNSGNNLQINYYDSSGNVALGPIVITGTHAISTAVAYPASLASSISVGAATDKGFRADYSEYGSNLDLLAPSGSGFNDVVSLDVTGTSGRSGDDFNRDFGGTSAACPLAAGIGALMISTNPQLTAIQIKGLLHMSCDKIGGVTYTGGDVGAGGRHNEYGYGRVNAFKAISAANSLSPGSLSAYYKLDEGTGSVVTNDSSMYGNTATMGSSFMYNNSRYSGVSGILRVAGTYYSGNPYILTIPNNTGNVLNIASNSPFTVTMWFKHQWISSGSFESVIMTNEVTGSSGFRITAEQSPLPLVMFRLRVYSTSSGGTLLAETPFYDILPEVWRHVAVTYDGATATIYLNGQAVAIGGGNIVGNSQNIKVAGALPGLRDLSGSLDELRFYKSALSSADVAQIAAMIRPSGYYKLDEGSGSVANDSSGNSVSASFVSSSFFSATAAYTGASGLAGVAFNGVGNYMSVPNSTGQIFSTSVNAPITIAMWVNQKWIQSGNFESVLASNEVTGASGFRFTVEQQNSGPMFRIRFYSTSGGGTLLTETPFYNVTPEKWWHMAVTYNGTTATIYLNGQAVATGTGNIVGNTQPIRVAGGISGLRTLSGYMDEVQFYRYALDQSNIAILYGQP